MENSRGAEESGSMQNVWLFDGDGDGDGSGNMTLQGVFIPSLVDTIDRVLVHFSLLSYPYPAFLHVQILPQENMISITHRQTLQSPHSEIAYDRLPYHSLFKTNLSSNTTCTLESDLHALNQYSSIFTIETSGRHNYTKSWYNNMKESSIPEPPYTEPSNNEIVTHVSCTPDMSLIAPTVSSLIITRLIEIAGCYPSLTVSQGEQQIYFPDIPSFVQQYQSSPMQNYFYKKITPHWKVCISTVSRATDANELEFMNLNISTIPSKCVRTYNNTLLTYIMAQFKLRYGSSVSRKKVQKQLLFFHVRTCSAVNSFLPTSEDLILMVEKLRIIPLLGASTHKKPILDPKLNDALHAGTERSNECTLILTEGDSAKAFAVAGISVLKNRSLYGIFPLRGKLINVRSASSNMISKNNEIQTLMKIIGLEMGVDYSSVARRNTLRYGKVMIMTDQDCDGCHIKGLIMNLFHFFWPCLIRCNDFLQEFITPIIKVTKEKETKSFFHFQAYQAWKIEQREHIKEWTIKYYKGLGTNTSKEAKQYFKAISSHLFSFYYGGEEDDEKIELAFSPTKVAQRREWLRNVDARDLYLHHKSGGSISIVEFIDKELIHYCLKDCRRCIPSIMDGLKPTQRKILFSCFKKNLSAKYEIKVVQLAGYVAEHTAYHHGEMSLMMTIKGMAQDFVGSNNINLLHPSGQFGTRSMGGKDAASARYIFTSLMPITNLLFRSDDNSLLPALMDNENIVAEPAWYVPVIPLLLVNGAEGIGCGYSTSIPKYNPLDIIRSLESLIVGEEIPELVPWYKGFHGIIVKNGDAYTCEGKYEMIDDCTIRITELPIGVWNINYKDMLDQSIKAQETNQDHSVHDLVKSYQDKSKDHTIDIHISILPDALKGVTEDELKKELKLTKKMFHTRNFTLFNAEGKICKYESANEILKEFYDVRLCFYEQRRVVLMERQTEKVKFLENHLRFVHMVNRNELYLFKENHFLIAELANFGFDLCEVDASPFEYLLGQPLSSLTKNTVAVYELKLKKEKELLEQISSCSPKKLWLDDLSQLKNGLQQL